MAVPPANRRQGGKKLPARHSLALDVFAGVPSASYGYDVALNAVERYSQRTDDSLNAASADDYDPAGNRTVPTNW